MLEFLNSKLVLGTAFCLVFILLLDSRVDASALNSRRNSGESSEEKESGWGRDWDWDWRDRDKDKDKKNKKFKCPSSKGNFADIEDCSSYFKCDNWKAKWRNCEKKKRFDRYRRTCLPFIIAVCDDGKDDKKSTKEDTRTTTPKGNVFTCPSFKGTFPHPDDCSKYYDCTFYIPSLKTCPKNQLFDGVKKECRPQREVDCGSRKRPTSETTAGTTPIVSSPVPSSPQPTTTPPTSPQPTTTPPTPSQPVTTPPVSTPPTTTPPTTTPPTTTPPTTTPPTTTPPTTTPPTTTPPTTTPPTTTPPTTTPPTTTPGTTPKPTGPPETDCDEDDLDCIIKETGEIPEWFECPEAVGAYRHPSSKRLFIFCKNWKPSVKKCGQDLEYSEAMRTCVSV